MLNEIQFFMDLHSLMREYKSESSWFMNMVTRSTNAFTRRQEDSLGFCLRAAWTIYKNVFNGRVQEIYLGDTAIRQEQQNLLSFGMLSATDVAQDPQVNQMVASVTAQRQAIDANTHPELQENVPVTQTGAILSTIGWSPMLNDAMIIAGADQSMEFNYILSAAEASVFERVSRSYDYAFGETTHNFNGDQERIGRHNRIHGGAFARQNDGAVMLEQRSRDRETRARVKWQAYFKTEYRALWENGFPRMFARELLGLQLFGYEPVFDEDQITFQRVHASTVTFRSYLECLRRVGFHMNSEKQIIGEIAFFLFGDRSALK